MLFGRFIPWSVSVGFLFAAPAAHAEIDALQPVDGSAFQATNCPVAPCRASVPIEVTVAGAPVDRVNLFFSAEDGRSFVQPLCSPPDPIEGLPGCPDLPTTFVFENDKSFRIPVGDWTMVAVAQRGAAEESGTPVRFAVLAPTLSPVGPVALSSVSPLTASPALRARHPSAGDPNGKVTVADTVVITGTNLAENPFLRVFIAPIHPAEPDLTSESALPAGDWCMHEATIEGRTPGAPGASSLTVRLPELNVEAPTTCGVPAGGMGSIYQKAWRIVIRDPWIRPERKHRVWAIPSQRDVPWKNAPPLQLQPPSYPLINGFGFENMATNANYNEFLTVYGNNAFICVDCLPVVGCACALPRIPDPIYALWYPVYKKLIDDTEGSCNGMAATSLRMSLGKLSPEIFEAPVVAPVGFSSAGEPAKYKDTNFCTPYCSPPKPDNLWATIRKNHGSQLSREYLVELLESTGQAIFDPSDLSALKGVPEIALERVRANPRGHVLCFFEIGNGHCVTPYAVSGDDILVYDNNNVEDTTRVIKIANGRYDYEARRNEGKEPNSGRAIIAFPIGIFDRPVNFVGINDFLPFGGSEFRLITTVGEVDTEIRDPSGGAFGRQADGTFADTLGGAVAVPMLGPRDAPARSVPLLVQRQREDLEIAIRGGGNYIHHVAEAGRHFQIAVNGSAASQPDRIDHLVGPDGIERISFAPAATIDRLLPSIGLIPAEGARAVMSLEGLNFGSGGRISFGGTTDDMDLVYENRTDGPTLHMVTVEAGAEDHVRMHFGPFAVAAGSAQRLVLDEWPDIASARSETDLDGDGTADQSVVVAGRPVPPPKRPGQEADLLVELIAAPEQPKVGSAVVQAILVRNLGPDKATGVRLSQGADPALSLEVALSAQGRCQISNSELSCQLGELIPGGHALVGVTSAVALPGDILLGTSLSSNERDPDPSNNSVFYAADAQ